MVNASPPTVQTRPADAPIEEILEIIHRDGVIVLSDFATEEEVDALNAKTKPHFDKVEREGGVEHKVKGFRASNTHVFYDLIGAVPEDTCKLLQRKVWKAVMEEFLSYEIWDWYGTEKLTRKCKYWLHTSIAYKVKPGAGNQVLHREQVLKAVREWALIVSTFIAGCDVTAKNGGTHVVPGSHQWSQDRAPSQEDAAVVEMKKGSLAIWLGDIFHGAGSNTCSPDDPQAIRYIYGLFATSDNFRQGEITALACSPEEFKKMPPDVLRLLGLYKGISGGGALGGRDPVDVWPAIQGYQGGEWIYTGDK